MARSLPWEAEIPRAAKSLVLKAQIKSCQGAVPGGASLSEGLQVPWVTPEEPYFPNHNVLPGELIINCGSSCSGKRLPLEQAF